MDLRNSTITYSLLIILRELTMRRLASGQSPGLVEDFLQERRLQFQVLWHYVQTEKMAVDAAPRHGVLVTQLMTLARLHK